MSAGISERGRRVAEWFGVAGPREEVVRMVDVARVVREVGAGRVVLITGASGAGKSSLLRAVRGAMRPRVKWVEMGRIAIPDRMVVDCFGRGRLEEILEILGRVGLGEVWTYLRQASQLSEGQRWRLRMALALARGRKPEIRNPKSEKGNRETILAADEFGAVLDRVTACVVARCLRRAVDREAGIGAVVATSHGDLERALEPDAVVECDFGEMRMRNS